MLIDFDKGEEMLNKFAGSEAKTTIRYENDIYMIKYPDPIRQKKNLLSYMNNQYSEHYWKKTAIFDLPLCMTVALLCLP